MVHQIWCHCEAGHQRALPLYPYPYPYPNPDPNPNPNPDPYPNPNPNPNPDPNLHPTQVGRHSDARREAMAQLEAMQVERVEAEAEAEVS